MRGCGDFQCTFLHGNQYDEEEEVGLRPIFGTDEGQECLWQLCGAEGHE